MKIAIVSHLKFPICKPFAGGLETFTYHYVRALQSRGHQVTLFASGDSDDSLPLQALVPAATIPHSQRRFGSRQDEWIEATEDEAYAALMDRLATPHFDVIHNHSLSPIPLRFANVVAAPIVTTLHAPVLPRMADELELRGSKSCGHFVNISQANAQAWRSTVASQEVIYNGVDTDFWKRCTDQKCRRAIWFGRILADKGTHYAIDAAHRAGLPIDVVGPVSDDEYFNSEVLPRLGPKDKYLGHRSHDQLCRLISRSAVALVTPCWEEPFGLVVAEALACGTPVAGFARGALPEIVRPSVGALVPPGDTDALARAIGRCLTMNGEVCRRVAQENFSFERMMNDYEVVYRKLMSDTVPQQPVAA